MSAGTSRNIYYTFYFHRVEEFRIDHIRESGSNGPTQHHKQILKRHERKSDVAERKTVPVYDAYVMPWHSRAHRTFGTVGTNSINEPNLTKQI